MSLVWGTGSGRQGKGRRRGSALVPRAPHPPPTWAFSIRRPVLWPLVPSELCPLPALRMLPTLPSLPTLFLSPAAGAGAKRSEPRWAPPTAGWPEPDAHAGAQHRHTRSRRGHTWAVWAEAHPGQLAIGEGVQGLLGRGLRCPGEAWAQGGGHRGEAGRQDTHPLADHLDDARGKVAHTVGAPLALVDVALPAAVWVLLKHLWQMGRGAWSLPAPSGQPAAMVQLLPSPQGAPPDAQVGL